MKIIEMIQDFTGIEFSLLVTLSLLMAFFIGGCVRVARWLRS